MDDPTVKTVDLTKKLLEIVVSSNSYSVDQLKQKANDIKSAILNIKNISEVKIYGDSDIFYELLIYEKKIEAYGLKRADIYNILQTISYIYPLGTIEDKTKHYALSTYNGAKTAQELEDTQITINQKVLYLKDIATIRKKYEDTDTLFSLNGANALNLTINQSADGDATKIEQNIQKVLELFNVKDKNISYKIVDNQSVKIKDRLNIVVSNILLGLIVITLIVVLLIIFVWHLLL